MAAITTVLVLSTLFFLTTRGQAPCKEKGGTSLLHHYEGLDTELEIKQYLHKQYPVDHPHLYAFAEAQSICRYGINYSVQFTALPSNCSFHVPREFFAYLLECKPDLNGRKLACEGNYTVGNILNTNIHCKGYTPQCHEDKRLHPIKCFFLTCSCEKGIHPIKLVPTGEQHGAYAA